MTPIQKPQAVKIMGLAFVLAITIPLSMFIKLRFIEYENFTANFALNTEVLMTLDIALMVQLYSPFNILIQGINEEMLVSLIMSIKVISEYESYAVNSNGCRVRLLFPQRLSLTGTLGPEISGGLCD
ncbi:hypothetical protein LOAG_02262 [Loa loa]|uniref:Uncharacterized protein n=1 Tax=Loa loa TaxID=7209 RepID=A0A1S0U7E6_LOALO|nr:hypothetical protein LOAG_02262 [Loa loa]EFO26222.1 hypothetical protein LOAG_02262 [Loa loa]